MNASVTQAARTVQFSDDTYATIDPRYNLATLHRGRNEGLDSDWGGQQIAAIELDKLVALAKVVLGGDPTHAEWVLRGGPIPADWFTLPDEAYRDAKAMEYHDDYIGI
jgi:hypothetical protein